MPNNFNTLIDNTSCIDSTASIYRGVTIDNSVVGENCVVGDFTRLKNVNLSDYAKADRDNFLLNSSIGTCSYTGRNDTILHSTIGKFCSIAWNISIGPAEHNYNKITSHDFLYNNFYGICGNTVSYDRFELPCEIGNDVWIGANSIILRGVKIGNGCVIGANSVVTKDIPPYAIAVGSPAKVIKYRFSESVIEELQQLEWWNLPLQVIRENFSLFSNNNIKEIINQLKELK